MYIIGIYNLQLCMLPGSLTQPLKIYNPYTIPKGKLSFNPGFSRAMLTSGVHIIYISMGLCTSPKFESWQQLDT